MVCGICGTAPGKRVISGIPMCEECFARITDLRNGNESTILFFGEENNIAKASTEARAYISTILNKWGPEKISKIRQHVVERQERELAKQEYARSASGLYEYDVVTILNEGHGRINRDEMLRILSSRTHDGWRLHTIYSNELGKNAMKILGIGLNETACEDVLIFERKLDDRNI